MNAAKVPWKIVPLDSKAHGRSAFACGKPELDRYIREQASQDVKRDVARVFVAPDERATRASPTVRRARPSIKWAARGRKVPMRSPDPRNCGGSNNLLTP